MKRGLLFDLDGVLVDTAKYHYKAWKELADELGIPFTLADNERLKGVSRKESFEILLQIGERTMKEGEKEEFCFYPEEITIVVFFDEVIDGTKVIHAKPHPEVFQKGAEALGLSCKECIVFEDSAAGITAAHRAGMEAVGIGNRVNLPEADTVIPDFLDFSVESFQELFS